MSVIIDPIIQKLDDWFLGVVAPLYPVVSDDWFVLLPIPAVYEMITQWSQGHSDGQQMRRLSIIVGNGLVGYAAYYIGGPFPGWFASYLVIGLAFYGLMKAIFPSPPADKGWPDLDPCGNPIIRHGGGGGGAC